MFISGNSGSVDCSDDRGAPADANRCCAEEIADVLSPASDNVECLLVCGVRPECSGARLCEYSEDTLLEEL